MFFFLVCLFVCLLIHYTVYHVWLLHFSARIRVTIFSMYWRQWYSLTFEIVTENLHCEIYIWWKSVFKLFNTFYATENYAITWTTNKKLVENKGNLSQNVSTTEENQHENPWTLFDTWSKHDDFRWIASWNQVVHIKFD